jgi:hypothetical protein
MNTKTANKIYDILVKECGAWEEERNDFVLHQTREEEQMTREWRFCGKLGFGGKFWRNNDRLYVNYYNEDQSFAGLLDAKAGLLLGEAK